MGGAGQGLMQGQVMRLTAGLTRGLTVGLAAGLAGCSILEPWLGAGSADLNSLPPCVDDDCNCGDFASQAQAQTVLEAVRGDPYGLDRDGNGLACETLPPLPPETYPPAPLSPSPHLVLGNPSEAALEHPNNYLVERDGYVLSYSRDRNLVNWASWEVDADWLGQVERQDDFRADGILPAGFYQVTANDYRGSGYDRGHLVPSGDRTRRRGDNSATFLMTNILPQTPENNRGPWRELENYGRDLVYQFDRSLYVMAGPYGSQGTIGRNITVPSRLWKVMVVLDRQADGGLAIGPNTQVIAVDMPNSTTVDEDWRRYQTTIDRIEVATGYDLLSALPEDLQGVLESRESGE